MIYELTYLVITTVVAIVGVILLAYNAGKEYRRSKDLMEIGYSLLAMLVWLMVSVLWLPALILYIPFRIGYKGEKKND